MDLTRGNIVSKLIYLAVPIMLTSFMQMAYNLTDMLWIGRIGSKAVAAVGTAGFFMWLSMALVRVSQVGAEVGVSQSIGKQDIEKAKVFARGSLLFNGAAALIYGIALFFMKDLAIGFFNISDRAVNIWAIDYLSVISFGFVFALSTPVLSGIYNGSGNSKMPLVFNGIGLVINMVLDPLLIFGYGPVPSFGIVGAAYATVFAQLIVVILFLRHLKSEKSPFPHFVFFQKVDFEIIKYIVKVGLPSGVQSAMFTVFAMIIARLIASWGPVPIAVQKVGSQIESISWMTAMGFSTALSAFTGQNFGAGKWKRIYRGYFAAVGLMTVFGLFTSAILILFAEPIFSLFIPEVEAIAEGAVYLRILGVSQLFMCLEISTAGAFNGLGRTMPPFIVGTLFTGLRVPAAYILSVPALMGLNGIWWSISISSVLKGIVLVIWFVIILRNTKNMWLAEHHEE